MFSSCSIENLVYVRNLVFWFSVFITHLGLYIGNILALFYIVAYEPWYMALPLITLIGNPIIGGIHCAYNNVENFYRGQLGWPLIEQNFLPALIVDIKRLLRSTQ